MTVNAVIAAAFVIAGLIVAACAFLLLRRKLRGPGENDVNQARRLLRQMRSTP
jgi:hypothetical protein